ncbi:MAG: hypothetical protein ACI4O5_01420 [Oscillospiraceae bacterium]
MNTYRITAAQEPKYRAQYIRAAEMIQDNGLSKSDAYRIIRSCPSVIQISVDGGKAYRAIPRDQYRLILSQKQPPGNPLMHKSSFQRRMAMRRWDKRR